MIRGRGNHTLLSATLWTACVFVFTVHVAAIIRSTGVPIAGNDFPAFYCAGQALLNHADPYATEPLRSCEHHIPNGSDLPAQYVTPAPLPPYALGLFALLAQLPYRIAAWIWFWIIALSCGWLAALIARVTRLPIGAIGCALLLSAGLGSAVFGQIPPLATLAIALAGTALVAGNDALAAVCAAAAMIEPHIGLATVLSLFFYRPAARGWLIACGLGLATLSSLVVTPNGVVAYVTSVLPAQAHAELLSADQFSLSHVLARIGLPDNASLLAGALSYGIMLAIGLAAAPVAAKRLGVAALAYIPAAATLLAGTFIHEIQLVAALPAAFLAIAYGTRGAAWCARFLVVAIAAVPYVVVGEHRISWDLLALLCATGAVATASLPEDSFDFTVALGAFIMAAACVTLPLIVQRMQPPIAADVTAVTAPMPSSGASANWEMYLRSNPRYDALQPGAEAAKLPAWLGLIALLSGVLTMANVRVGPRTQPAWDRRPRFHTSP